MRYLKKTNHNEYANISYGGVFEVKSCGKRFIRKCTFFELLSPNEILDYSIYKCNR